MTEWIELGFGMLFVFSGRKFGTYLPEITVN